jgi:hypothetical protein
VKIAFLADVKIFLPTYAFRAELYISPFKLGLERRIVEDLSPRFFHFSEEVLFHHVLLIKSKTLEPKG